QALSELFDVVDTSRDGRLNVSEMKTMVRAVKPTATDSDVRQIFSRIDSSGNGALSKSEFITYFKNMFRNDSDADFRERINSQKKAAQLVANSRSAKSQSAGARPDDGSSARMRAREKP